MIATGRAERLITIVVMAVVLLAVMSTGAIAADGQPGWRPIFDLVMRWLNFLILVFIIVKFARRPLKAFLTRQKEDIAAEIDRLEQAKAALTARVQETNKQLEESNLRFEKLKERIVLSGEKRKQELIDEANRESEFLLEGAKRRIDNQVLQAKKSLRDDLIDTAFERALEKLPEVITSEDTQRLTRQYLDSTSQS